MKATHTLYLLFITLLCVAGFTACDDSGSDDMIWDFAPIELHIAVQDAQGNDLLNPETPGNIAKQGIKAIYNGKIYGDDTFDNEKVIIDWNDGTQDVITFSSKLIWKSKNKPVFDRKFCLNGKDNGLQFGGFVIIKEPVITSSTTSDQ